MLNPMNLNDRTVLVTGASSGIGRDTAVLLSELGAQVILVGRNQDQLNQTYALLNGKDHRIEAFELSSGDEIPAWMKRIAKDTGPLHGLVHCAGIQFTKPLRITTSVNFEELMRINVTAAFCLAKGFRQKGVYVPGGSIVYISSVMGLTGQAGVSAYSASKGALIALVKSLALELAKDKIRINCVAPAHVKTEMAERLQQSLTPEQFIAIESMHPLGIGIPRDVSHAIAFLLADTGRWVTGTTLVVDGGYTAH